MKFKDDERRWRHIAGKRKVHEWKEVEMETEKKIKGNRTRNYGRMKVKWLVNWMENKED